MKNVALVLAWVFVGAFVVAQFVRAEPPTDTSSVTRESQGSITYTRTVCGEVPVASSVELMESFAFLDPPLGPAQMGEIRFVEVVHADTTNDDARVCFSLGDDADESTLGDRVDCFEGDFSKTGQPLFGVGQSITYHVRRTKHSGGSSGAVPELWARSASGPHGAVVVCATVGI